MKRALLFATAILVSGCSSFDRPDVGYRSYDPCIRCGEGWIFLPNPSHAQQLADWKQANQKYLGNSQ